MSLFYEALCPSCDQPGKFLWSIDNVLRFIINLVARLLLLAILFGFDVLTMSYRCPECGMCFEG